MVDVARVVLWLWFRLRLRLSSRSLDSDGIDRFALEIDFGRVEPHPDEHKARRGKTIAYVQDDSLDQQMKYAMTHVPKHWLSVPIETSGDAGFNWGAMAEIRKAA